MQGCRYCLSDLFRVFACEDLAYGSCEYGYLNACYVPGRVEIKSEIIMHNPMSKTDNAGPGDFWSADLN
jgi:hypothetical protein